MPIRLAWALMEDEEDEGIAMDGSIAFLSFVSRKRMGFLCGFSVSLPYNLYHVYVCGVWNEMWLDCFVETQGSLA